MKKFYLIYNYLKLLKFFIKNLIQFFLFLLKNINFDNKINNKINKNPIFFSFFSYTDKQKAMSGVYQSEYWKGFSNTSNKNWLHLYDFSSNFKTSHEVRKVIKNLNLNNRQQNHFFLDDYLNIKVFIKTILVAIKFFFLTSKLFLSKNFNLILKNELYLDGKKNLDFYQEFI